MESKSKVQIASEELIQFFNEFEFKYSCASEERMNQIEEILRNLNDSESEKICNLFDGIKQNFTVIDSFLDKKLDELKYDNNDSKFKVQTKSRNNLDWTDLIFLDTLEEARKNLAFITDTPYYINCRIIQNNCIIEESGSNMFYGMEKDKVDQYISGKITLNELKETV